ncbi:MAG: hypothetical protein HY898_14595 [Deltaproteobacteria bacterium]|nr:hypothetical protein [Deltaproteobacteria bacterium]
MAIVFRVGFDGESRCVDAVSEGHYLVTKEDEGVVHLLDDEDSAEPKSATTFDRALAMIAGWQQGVPMLVDPSVAEYVSAALISHQGRSSNAWQEWLRTGKTRGK